jgi:hypothetical protein
MEELDTRSLAILAHVDACKKVNIDNMIRNGTIANGLGSSNKPCVACNGTILCGSAVYVENGVIKRMIDKSSITQHSDGATVLPFCSPSCAYMIHSGTMSDMADMFYDTRDSPDFNNQANKIWRHIPKN